MKNIVLKNDVVKMKFSENTGNLERIEYKNNIMKFSKSIWNIEFKKGDNVIKYSIFDMNRFEYISHNESLELCWKNDTAEVKVYISYLKGNFRWKITAESLAKDVYIEKIIFPVLGNIKQFEKARNNDYLLLPWQNGCLVKNPVDTLLNAKTEMPFYLGRGKEKYENDYPSQYSFQFAAYYSLDDYGYYFATEDPDVYFKTMGFYKSTDNTNFDFAIINYPEHMGETKYYNMPYSFVLDFFEGGWQTPVNKYRKWAIKQGWCKELLVNKNIPDNLLNSDLWLMNHGNHGYGTEIKKYYESVLLLKEKLDFNIALHWYGWNKGEFDVDYPEYISEEQKAAGLREELKEWNRKFKRNGIVKIPYINARLWDIYTSSWKDEGAHDAALKDENMELYEEPWKNNTLRPMCPSTVLWADKIVEFCSDYIRNLEFDGLYMDQVASFNSTLCFDRTHSHPVGGGKWWNDSYHKIINTLRGFVGDDKLLTTESCCETYIDVFDLFLIMDTDLLSGGFNSVLGHGNNEPIPLFSMIYGDYALSYGSICAFSDQLKLFEYKLIRNLLWGILPTITIDCTMSDGFKSGELEGHLNVLKKVLSFFKNNKNLFLYGRIARILGVIDETIEISLEHRNGKISKKVPSVISVLWEDEVKKQFYLIYNFSDETQTIMLGKPEEILPGEFYIIEK